jgi:nucleoside-diphosphate-sugar epimerase
MPDTAGDDKLAAVPAGNGGGRSRPEVTSGGQSEMRGASSNVLVTGASGFIGRALVRRLVAEGRTTVCTARRPAHDIAEGVAWIPGDLTDRSFVERLVAEARPAVVYHLASQVTGSRSIDMVPSTLANNLVASVSLLSAVTEAGCERVVLIGSGDEPTTDGTPCSPYAATKWAVAGYARMFLSLYGTPVTTARPFMVYGPDQPDTTKVVPYAITSLLRGEAPELSSGRRLCDWVYIDDVVDALLVLATAPEVIGRVVDVGSGHLHTVRHVVKTVATLVGAGVEPVFGGLADRQGETEAVADVAETARVCGWRPATDLYEGLKRTVAWYS